MTGKFSANESTVQTRLIAALLDGNRYPHAAKSVRLIETHISWVLLAGRYAYKIKKALALGFLDFTSLDRRHFYCDEEIRINHRTAPQIYIDVISIGGDPDNPIIGGQPAIEHAVRMRRFSVANGMDMLMMKGKVLPEHIDSLANVLAHFHLNLPTVAVESSFGKSGSIRELALHNFLQLPATQLDTIGKFVIAALQNATEDEHAACAPLMEHRRLQGFVRECHGDLHLGNIVLRSGTAIPFDGIEFDPALRWTDIICDVAFPFMDLLYFKRPDFAYRFLNAWLEITGDYAGIALLRFYASYRAAVRAKVNAIRAAQPALTSAKRAQAQEAFRRYLSKACNCLLRSKPALVITHGLPGSGKTTFSQMALERFGAIRIRSDVERKRMYGMSSLERSGSAVGDAIYSSDATVRTYGALHDLARGLLKEGHRVIVDAAFLTHEEREQFRRLAQEMSAPFVIASIQARDAAMRTRIEQRMRQRKDASEADVNVLEALQLASKPLQDLELAETVMFFNNSSVGFAADDPGWGRLDQLLS